VADMDLVAYSETIRSLLHAKASDVLPTVTVPTLVVAPERDVMALQGDLNVLREGIPGAEWLHIPRTGHAILLEAGDTIARRVVEFFDTLPR